MKQIECENPKVITVEYVRQYGTEDEAMHLHGRALYNPDTGTVTAVTIPALNGKLGDVLAETVETYPINAEYIVMQRVVSEHNISDGAEMWREATEKLPVEKGPDGVYHVKQRHMYDVTFVRKGYARVEACTPEEAAAIAEASVKADNIYWDDDWSVVKVDTSPHLGDAVIHRFHNTRMR